MSDRWQKPDEGASETEFRVLLPTRKLRALKLGRKTTRGTDHALETAGRGPQDRVTQIFWTLGAEAAVPFQVPLRTGIELPKCSQV